MISTMSVTAVAEFPLELQFWEQLTVKNIMTSGVGGWVGPEQP